MDEGHALHLHLPVAVQRCPYACLWRCSADLCLCLCCPGEPLMTQETIDHITSVIAEKGSDAWYQSPVEALLPDSLKGQADLLDKGQDTMDVW